MKDDNNENRVIRKTAVIIPLLAVAVLVVAFAANITFGWLAINRDLEGRGAGLKVDGDMFELAVTVADLPEESDSEIVTFLAEETNGGYAIANITSMATPSIIGKMVDEAPKTSDEIKLAPGSFGYITFYIVPKLDGDHVFEVSIQFTGSNKNELNTDSAIYDYADAETLMNGHILLFSSRSAVGLTAYYHYSGLITDAFTYDTAEHTAERIQVGGDYYYPVTVYWIWPSTFGQMVFDESNALARGRTVFESESSAARSSFVSYVTAHPELFFRDRAGSYSGFSALMADLTTNHTQLGEGYNNGDQRIGDNIKWVVAEIKCSYVRQSN